MSVSYPTRPNVAGLHRQAVDSDEETSWGSMTILAGELTLWGAPGDCEDTNSQVELRLAPKRPIVVGRAEGGRIEYLDPTYCPTTILPNTDTTILKGQKSDLWVSRGHFTLWAGGGLIILVNGVPNREGGIRPPKNGTWLLVPAKRLLREGERYVIARGARVVLRLPNGAEIQIQCN